MNEPDTETASPDRLSMASENSGDERPDALRKLFPEAFTETLQAIDAMKPRRVLCLDRAFHGNDALKTSAVLQMRDRGIEFRTV